MTLKEQLERGEYQVDTKTVADAVLRSPLWILLTAGTAAGGQSSVAGNRLKEILRTIG